VLPGATVGLGFPIVVGAEFCDDIARSVSTFPFDGF
jgi:hypothetical protein